MGLLYVAITYDYSQDNIEQMGWQINTHSIQYNQMFIMEQQLSASAFSFVWLICLTVVPTIKRHIVENILM